MYSCSLESCDDRLTVTGSTHGPVCTSCLPDRACLSALHWCLELWLSAAQQVTTYVLYCKRNTSLHRSSSDHSVDAASALLHSGAGGCYRRERQMDRRTDGRTDPVSLRRPCRTRATVVASKNETPSVSLWADIENMKYSRTAVRAGDQSLVFNNENVFL